MPNSASPWTVLLRVTTRSWRSSTTRPSGIRSGGLVSALQPVLRDRHGIWIGWLGSDFGDCPERRAALAVATREAGYALVPVDIPAAQQPRDEAPVARIRARLLRDDVGLRDDAEDLESLTDHGDARDSVLEQDRGDVLERRLRTDRDRIPCHEVRNLHVIDLLSPQGSAAAPARGIVRRTDSDAENYCVEDPLAADP